MFTPCWTQEEGKPSPIHTSLNQSILGVQFSRRPDFTAGKRRTLDSNSFKFDQENTDDSILMVSSETSVFVYTAKDKVCEKSWLLEGSLAKEEAALKNEAVLVPRTDSIVCPLGDGSSLFHFKFSSPSGSIKVTDDCISKLDLPAEKLLIHEDLEGVVVLVSNDGSISLYTVADDYFHTSAPLSPANEENVEIKVKGATLEAVKFSKLRSREKKNSKSVAVEWQVILTEEISNGSAQPSLRIRVVDIKPKSSMLTLSKGPSYSVAIPSECQNSKNESSGLDLVSSCILDRNSVYLVWRNGMCQHIALTPRKKSADLVSCRSMRTPVGQEKKQEKKVPKKDDSGLAQEFSIFAASPLVQSTKAKPAALCYSFTDGRVGIFDVKFGVPLEHTSIFSTAPTDANAKHFIGCIENCPVSLGHDADGGSQVALVDDKGSVYLYKVSKVESSLCSALGKLSSISHMEVADSAKSGSLNKAKQKSAPGKEKRKWSEAFFKSNEEAVNLFEKVKGMKQDRAIKKHVELFISTNNGTIPYNLTQKLVLMCIKSGDKPLWQLLQTLLRTGAVSVCANESLIPTLIQNDQVALILDVLLYCEDITEKCLIDIVVYITRNVPSKALTLLGKEVSSRLKAQSDKMDETMVSILKPDQYTQQELGVHAILLGVLSVPNNQIFMVQMLKSMDQGAVETLFSVLAYALISYHEAPDIQFKKYIGYSRIKETKSSLRSLCPTYTTCLKWISLLLDARFHPIVVRAADSERLKTLANLVSKSCVENVNLCEGLMRLQTPLGQYLKQRVHKPVHQFPSDYSVEYILI
mmetsp:Transcript_5260/g.6985  ORF Transcript_5260/g.6985 Transcript_5260/m.6985 type:complete len:808 (-) Transcript_5260:35-2458(-)